MTQMISSERTDNLLLIKKIYTKYKKEYWINYKHAGLSKSWFKTFLYFRKKWTDGIEETFIMMKLSCPKYNNRYNRS